MKVSHLLDLKDNLVVIGHTLTLLTSYMHTDGHESVL